MTTSSRLKLPSLPWLGASLGCFLLGAWPAGAQVLLTNVMVVNVTPSSFSVVASASSAITSSSAVSVDVFSSAEGGASLAGQVGVEYFPLNSGDPSSVDAYRRLMSMAVLRQDSMNLGLIYARISDCSPNTTYYYQITVTNADGQWAVWPRSGPLPSATTARENSFVLQSQQLLVTLGGSTPPGSLLSLSASNSPSVLAAVVGDGAATNQAFFNLNDLLAASGGTNYSPLGSQSFIVSVLGPSSSGLTRTYELDFSSSFSVGQASAVSLGAALIRISLGTGAMLTGSSGSVPISVDSQSALIGLSFVVELPTNLFTAMSVQPTAPALTAASLSVLASNAVELSFSAASGLNLAGNQQIAKLSLTAASNQSSALLPLWPQAPQSTNATAGATNIFSIQPGRAVILGPQPVLVAQLEAGNRELVLYGIPGRSYQIQSRTDLALPSAWVDFLRVPMTNLAQVIPVLDSSRAVVFFRAYVLSADPPILEASLSGANRSLLAFGLPGTNYTLLTSSNLSATVAWQPLLNYTLTNSFQFFTNLGSGSPAFYRAKKR
jgi:hypothetical protein